MSRTDGDIYQFCGDLDAALRLFVNTPELYERLEEKERYILLQILAKRIIINIDGQIIDQELQSPFAYLMGLAGSFAATLDPGCGSEQFRLGAPKLPLVHPNGPIPNRTH